MRVIATVAAVLFIIACGDETKPVPSDGETTGKTVFDVYKDYAENGESTPEGNPSDPNTGMPCDDKEGVDTNGDGVISNCDDNNTVPGDPGQPDGGYGVMPLCPEILGLNFDTCRPEMGRPLFIIDFGRACVLGMKCEYGGTEPACPMVWAPVCGVDGWTYDNDCFAKIAGVEIAYKGECWGGPNGPECPDLAYPAPDFCPNGKIIPVYDKAIGCQVGWDCYYENEPIYCKADADCDAGMYCVNGVCNYGDPFECPVGTPNPEDYCADGSKMVPIYDERGCVMDWYCEGGTDPNDPTEPGCPAIDMMMPDCGDNLKPEPIYDAAGCQTGWACPL